MQNIQERLKYGLLKKGKRIQGKSFVYSRRIGKEAWHFFASVNRWEQGIFEPTMKSKRKFRKLFIEAGIKEELSKLK